MRQVVLGKTGLKVSRLFIGTGTWDFKAPSAQAKIPPEQFAPILKHAYEKGINFWDTAEEYHTHQHVRLGMQGISRESLVIATKTYGGTSGEALRILNQALLELGTDYVDIFFLHSVDSIEAYEKRIGDALTGLQQARKEGKIKAIGLSTHNIHVLDRAVDHPELEIIFTNFNKYEIHMDASLQWYSRCLERGFKSGKGILVMKTLGEGKLRDRVRESVQFNLSKPFVHAVCVGIVSLHDLDEALKAAEEVEV